MWLLPTSRKMIGILDCDWTIRCVCIVRHTRQWYFKGDLFTGEVKCPVLSCIWVLPRGCAPPKIITQRRRNGCDRDGTIACSLLRLFCPLILLRDVLVHFWVLLCKAWCFCYHFSTHSAVPWFSAPHVFQNPFKRSPSSDLIIICTLSTS